VVAGISNGAFMGRRLGLEASDQVAGISSRDTCDSGAGGTRVVSWTVFGGGHTWPGSPAAPGLADLGAQEFDAAEEICRFAGPLLASADSRRL
jgi:polyhydroxybutyrate depolymerase